MVDVMENPFQNGHPQAVGWLISWKSHLEVDDLGVALFQETPKWCNSYGFWVMDSEPVLGI